MSNNMEWGERLRRLRKQSHLSQAYLAAQLGVDTSLISRFESGEREPSAQQAIELARVLGVSIDYLLNATAQPRFMLRGTQADDADGSIEIRRVMTDAEQQIHYLHAAYESAGQSPRRLALRYDIAEIGHNEWPDFVDELRTTLQLNQYVSLGELKQALRDRQIHVFEWNMPLNLSGMSYRGNFTVIFINQAHGLARRLFTLAHELAHVLFHFEKDKDEAGIVSLFSRRTDQHEKDANRFASELLMPSRLIEAFIQQLGPSLRTMEGLETLAQRFNVSRDAMFYRLASQQFFKWTEKKRYFTETPSAAQKPIRHRVSNIAEQVSPEFLQIALGLIDDDSISAGKLAEWLFASRPTVEAFLAERYFQTDSFIV
jgi:Zn-dependent peptidase ImmA (M78 family)/transcriptional regulator with XRE-family HTH domain